MGRKFPDEAGRRGRSSEQKYHHLKRRKKRRCIKNFSPEMPLESSDIA